MTKFKSRFSVFVSVLVLLALFSLGQAAVAPFPQAVINHMATREMRYHHYMWHQVRENWNKFTAETKDAFTKIGWTPRNPARTFDPVTGEAAAVLDNYSGEDFLYMHRQMIRTANSIIAQNQPSYGRIQGWKTLPAPGDPDYPVPPNYTIPNNAASTSSTNSRKTDSYYTRTILPNERLFKDPVRLRNMTLAELGARIEVTIHSYLHMRFSAANSVGYRNSFRGTIPLIDKKWDNIAYDWLGDSYASHVHPIFWKIHGWVDDRIEDWRLANNLTSIRWRGTWVGGPMANLSSVINAKQSLRGAMGDMDMSEEEDGVGNVIEEAMQLFLKSGVPEANFSEDVALPPLDMDDSEDEVGDISEEAMDIWLNSGVKEHSFGEDVDLPPIGMGSSEKEDDEVGDVSEEAMDIWLGSGVKEHSFGEDVDLPPIGMGGSSHGKPKHCKRKAI